MRYNRIVIIIPNIMLSIGFSAIVLREWFNDSLLLKYQYVLPTIEQIIARII